MSEQRLREQNEALEAVAAAYRIALVRIREETMNDRPRIHKIRATHEILERM